MKLLIVIMALGLAACGKGPDNAVPAPRPACESVFPRGIWVGTNYSHSFRVVFGSDCTASVSIDAGGVGQVAKFTWAKPASGYMQIDVSETSGSSFLPQTTGAQSIPYAYQESNGVVSLVIKFDASNNFNLTLGRE